MAIIKKKFFAKSIYWHLKKDGIRVRAGQSVKMGDIIALADNTGISTGDHLHFGLKPMYHGEKEWEWWNAEQNNGFRGAIDPAPYFTGRYADDTVSVLSPADAIAVEAARSAAMGNQRVAQVLFALADFLRSFAK